MLGWFKSLNHEIDGVTGSESNPISISDPNSPLIFFKDNSEYVDPNPGHSIQAIYEQVFGRPWTSDNPNPPHEPTMNGFVQNAEGMEKGMAEAVMKGFVPDAVPVFKELALNFAVCDRWFASVPASTQPNRMFVHSATSHGLTSNDTMKLIEGFPQKTIFESLDESGFSFGIHYQYPPSTLFYRNLRQLKYLKNFHQFDLHFKKHCEEGKLPNYVVIEQRYFNLLLLPANDDHPSHDVSECQKFVKEVYEALRASPQWNEMFLVITYDEHGGFYDHVPTPTTGVPSPIDIVPNLIHGPSGPYPTSEFEHSSIPETVKKIFNLKEFLTKRDAWAGTFEGVLTRKNPRTDCPATIPEPVKTRRTEAKETEKLSDFQEELVQMAAVLKGDHKSDIYPHKLVENMTVAEAAKYVHDAFDKFCDEYLKEKGAEGNNESEIVELGKEVERPNRNSFISKLFSCLSCR
ncbi:Non-specific phospholipase C4 [Hibiscus syriacus]|uniref:Non-specific phospholipase C4 n=1 Tax=Hibiscus syriacus TaxID=106335 RepID=A0A6A3C2W0_HIBSY|nr:Non-specific phospholipase C4 [Hibiscus syriacus]